MVIARIFSDGQEGVARGAIEAARELRVSYGIPKYLYDGGDFDPFENDVDDEPVCDAPCEKNVIHSKATLILTLNGVMDGPVHDAKELCEKHNKPYLVWDLNNHGLTNISPQNDVVNWLSSKFGYGDIYLNVAGPTESECPGIQAKSKAFVMSLLNMMPEFLVRKVLAKTVKPEELDDAVEWATAGGYEMTDVQPFIEWAERYRPTSEYEVSQMSFHLGKPGVWSEPTRESYTQDLLWKPDVIKDSEGTDPGGGVRVVGLEDILWCDGVPMEVNRR